LSSIAAFAAKRSEWGYSEPAKANL